MNTQLVESIIQLVNALSPEERSLLKERLLHDDRTQAVDLNAFSGSIQLDQDPLIYQKQIRDEWLE